MKTVGSILKNARVSRGYTLSQVEAATKIREKFLTAIESDDYTTLPSLSYAKGFVKNYSEFLGLDSRTVLAFFRRQAVDPGRSSLLPKGVDVPLNRSFFQLTPGRFVGLLVAFFAFLFLIYLGLQYRTLGLNPTLVIESPETSGIVVSEKKIEVFGRTDPDATVTINGVSVLVREDGKFFDQVNLEPGVNTLTVTATSRFGKTTTAVREVGHK